MQAILTQYLPATNMRGSRIKATCSRGSKTIPYDHALESEENHIAAAQALCDKFIRQDGTRYTLWGERRIAGQLANGNYVHVFNS